MKRLCSILILALLVSSLVWAETGKADPLDKWRIEVGPPGNEFSDPQVGGKGSKAEGAGAESKGSEMKEEGASIPESAFRWVKTLAPETAVTSTGAYGDSLYVISENQRERYTFLISDPAGLAWLQYTDKLNRIEEAANAIVPRGKRQEIAVDKLPDKMVAILADLMPDLPPSQAWYADTLVGPRYIARVGETVFYATPGGNLRSAAAIAAGGLAEVAATATLGPFLSENVKVLLQPYRDRFNVQNQIERLRKRAGNVDEGFRFIAMGDSRSQKDLWEAITIHIDRLDPKPLFVINAGDVILNGTAAEFADYYIPPLLNTDIPYFIAAGNHDIGKSGEKGTYEYLFGEQSLNFTFDMGKSRFIILDNVSGKMPWEKVLELADGWLTETPKGHKKIVSVHMPPATIEKWAYHAQDLAGSKAFTDLMAKHKVDEVFLGHIHAYSTANLDGVPYTIAGGGGAELHSNFGPLGSVHHYIICDVTPDGITQQVVRFYRKDSDADKAQRDKGTEAQSKGNGAKSKKKEWSGSETKKGY